jgi:exoribonuclease-2
VQGLGSGVVTFGVHIAAPGLAIQPGSPVDAVARERLSTVYMPGWKLTMLPDDVVQRYTLQEGRDCPAVSLYVRFDEATLAVLGSETKLELVPIAANLRHDQLDAVITEASLTGAAPADYAFAAELAFGFRLARHLKAGREQVRGKPETFNRPDYNFRLEGHDGAEPKGDETVVITERRRGAPLDLIVAEAMILANNTWGGWLHELGLPGIYRTQASMAPGIKVRMGTKAQPHAGMGVAHYTWATSPLRRYVDLVNQWQIIAAAKHGRTAALVAPFKPKDAALFGVISSFDAAYTAYNGFQNGIERYWVLRWLAQQGATELDAAVMKDGLVRADTLPLVMRAIGAERLPRGARVRVRITGTDLLMLEAHAQVLTRLDDPATPADDAVIEEDAETEEAPVGLALAIDVAEEAQDENGSTPPATGS